MTNITQWMDTAACVRWVMTLVHFLWQGIAIALVAEAAAQFLCARSAQRRYAVRVVSLFVMAICPVVTYRFVDIGARPEQPIDTISPPAATSGVGDPWPMQRVSVEPGDASIVFPSDLAPAPPDPAAPYASTPLEPAESPSAWQRYAPVAATIYLVGVLALLLRLGVGLHGGRRLCHRSVAVTDSAFLEMLAREAATLGLRARPAIAWCREIAVPVVVGVLRPTILLPLSMASGLAPDQMESILRHELAHIRRYDHVVDVAQRLIEAFLFFHPAVWWLSSRIRVEREHCCDDRVVALGDSPLHYAESLLRVAELSQSLHFPDPKPAIIGLCAVRRPSRLQDRISRILGGSPEAHIRLDRRSLLTLLIAAVTLAIAPLFLSLRAESSASISQQTYDEPSLDSLAQPGARDEGDLRTTGPDRPAVAAEDVQARITCVAVDASDESPDLTKPVSKFARPEDITFAVELKNVSDKPIPLMGVRYGDSFAPPAPGKLNADGFGPYLFQFDFTDAQGRPIRRPARVVLERMLMMSGMSVHTLEPGQSHVVVLRPARFASAMDYQLPPGDYRARVRYRGPSDQVRSSLKQHWPDSQQATAWSGEALSNEVAFAIAGEPSRAEPALVWGTPVDGLRAAVELRPDPGPRPRATNRSIASTPKPMQSFGQGSKVDVRIHIQNVSERVIQFVSETWRQDDQVTVADDAGQERQLTGSWYSGWPIMVRWTLEPGQSADLTASNIGIAADDESAKKFEHPIGKVLVAKPGTYTMRWQVRMGGIQQKDKDGNVVVPGSADWQGTLDTGPTPVVVRLPQPNETASAPEPTFVGLVEFRSQSDAAVVERGVFEIREQDRNYREVARGEIRKGTIEVPGCPEGALAVTVRAPGYEEALFYDVSLKADKPKQLALAPAAPTRFRLVSSDGRGPVKNAIVRYFNRTSGLASAGPYPMHGTSGPVFATSTADGTVVLDMLQKIDPHYAKLGDSVYTFYIEPPGGLAPRFIGPVKAGQELGDIEVSPQFDVRGEIRGTAEELANFAAEWDQPVEMKSDNPQATWLYAVSNTLDTIRDGEILRFHLTGLRAGRLRIISNFGPGPHSVSHTYTRRDPGTTDVVIEMQLNRSLDDVVITPHSSGTGRPGPADDWGPEQDGLRTRLVQLSDKPSVGEPVKFRLEMKNFGNEVRHYDPQVAAAFRIVGVKKHDGDAIGYIGGSFQTAGQPLKIGPGETVALWKEWDVAANFLLEDAGNYTVQTRPAKAIEPIIGSREPKQSAIPASGPITFELAPGTLRAIPALFVRLRNIPPPGWKASLMSDVILFTHSPTSLKKDVTTIQLWFTKEKLPADFKLGQGEYQQVVQYLGETPMGHANLGALPRAADLWPDYVTSIRQRLHSSGNAPLTAESSPSAAAAQDPTPAARPQQPARDGAAQDESPPDDKSAQEPLVIQLFSDKSGAWTGLRIDDDSKRPTIERLQQGLKEHIKGNPSDGVVHIEADERLKYDTVRAVTEAVAGFGVRQIRFAKAPTPRGQGNSSIIAQVLDPSGRGTDSVYVNLWLKVQPDDKKLDERWEDGGSVWERVRSWLPSYPKPDLPAGAAAAQGWIAFSDVAAGEYRVTAVRYEGKHPANPTPAGASAPTRVAGDDPVSIPVRLAGDTPLSVRIVDSQSREPVQHVAVRLFQSDGMPIVGAAGGNGNFFDMPGERGEVRYDNLVPGTYRIEVTGRGASLFDPVEYSPVQQTAEVIAGRDIQIEVPIHSRSLTERELDERWPHSVHGRVTDGTGRPLPGVEITAHTGMGTLRTGGRTTTADDGRYVLRFGPGMAVMRNGKWGVGFQVATISPRLTGYFEKELGRHGNLAMTDDPALENEPNGYSGVVVPGKPKELNFVMIQAVQASGTLVDANDKPLAGYRIHLTGPDLPPSSSVLASGGPTDDAGRFQFHDIPAGYRYQILVEPPRAESPWIGWATVPFVFRDPGKRELVADFAGGDVAADRFRLQIASPGVNYREAMKQASERSIDYRAGDVRKVQDGDRVHLEASVLHIRI
jgi:beta-lactamase regulating signal transducer with metallopeptidase domain/biopolymer transport protein ExbD